MAVALLLAVGVVTAGLLTVTGGAAAVGSGAGISSIAGMSRVIADSPALCAGVLGTSLPDYCSWPGVSTVVEEGWVQTAAINQYGALNAGLSLPVPLSFAQEHPGPAEVFVQVVTLATQDEANRLLNDPNYIGSWDPNYTSLPNDAINSGVAFQINSLGNDGLGEFRFAWVGDTSVVEVNVIGANMSVAEAQTVAQLATPA